MQANIGGWTISIERAPYDRKDLTAKYDMLSPTWDRTLARLGFDRAYHDLFLRLADSGSTASLKRDARVFDAGIGTGALSYALATTYSQQLDVHGMDISANMLDTARDNLSQLQKPPTLRTGDARNLPYTNDYFDWVMTAHMLEHLANPLDGLRELVRVTKQGGTVMVIMTRKSFLGQYIDFQWRLNRVADKTLVRWMANLGLKNIQQHKLGGPVWSNWMSMAFTATK